MPAAVRTQVAGTPAVQRQCRRLPRLLQILATLAGLHPDGPDHSCVWALRRDGGLAELGRANWRLTQGS